MTESVQRLGIPIGVPAKSSEQVDRSYGRTDGRTNAESWLSSRDHLQFRNARAHIRISALGLMRCHANAEASA